MSGEHHPNRLSPEQLVEFLGRAVYDVARNEGVPVTVVCISMGIPPGVLDGDTRGVEVRGL